MSPEIVLWHIQTSEYVKSKRSLKGVSIKLVFKDQMDMGVLQNKTEIKGDPYFF